jgi:hypothetical protein
LLQKERRVQTLRSCVKRAICFGAISERGSVAVASILLKKSAGGFGSISEKAGKIGDLAFVSRECTRRGSFFIAKVEGNVRRVTLL